MAQPAGGTIAAGQAVISAPNAATTLITQSSQKAIINWQDFSVASGGLVQFAQPNSAAVTLNRVTGATPSAIDGAIRANGQVWLINPNGVLFGQGAQIHVGGLMATTSDIADGDFLSGNYNFSGSSDAAVVNNGSIHARKGGSVVLSGAHVANGGLIEAKAGHVVLGGADAFTVDFNGDHLLSYAVTAPVARQTRDANGNPQSATVSNSGVIRAAGGKVLMTARAAAGVADAVVNNSGMVEATSSRVENGEIILDAGDGAATSSGTLDASGKSAGQTGGSVQVLGQTVALADGAKIDVSGDAGGGQALIGGNFHGAGPQANARTTSVGKAIIKADAIRTGNGGKVAVWSDGRTQFAGAISAKGGAQSGNGGQVETSGHELFVSEAADVSTLAANGVSGNWLLDPHNITINNSGPGAVSPETFATNPSGDTTIDPTAIANAMANGNVILQANNDITVASTISVSSGNGNSLTLQAGRSIALTNSSSINISGGSLVLSANDGGAIAANRDAGPASISGGTVGGVSATGAGGVVLSLYSNGLDGSSIGSSGTPFLVTGGASTFIQTIGANAFVTGGDGVSTSFTLGETGGPAAVDLATGNLFIKAAGITQLGAITVHNLTVTLPASISSGNAVLLNDANNAITGTVNIAAMGGSQFSQGPDYIQLTNSQALTLGVINEMPNISSTDRGNITLTAANGALTLTGNIDAGQITLNGWGITQTGGVIYSHASSGSAGGMAINATNGGSLSLPDANIIEQFVAPTNNGSETAVSSVGQLVFISSGSANVNFASSLQLQGAYAQSGDLSITTTGSYNLSDPGGNLVKKYNSIIVNNPVSATGMVTLHAAGDVTQMVGLSSTVAITAPGGLIATSDNGQLSLADGGHAAGADDNNGPADAGNQVGGYVLLNAATDANFTNTINTILGVPGDDVIQTSVIGGNLDVEVTDAGQSDPNVHSTLTMNGRVHTQQSVVSGDTVLHASGDIINNIGNGTITATNLSLVSDNGTVGAPSPGGYFAFGLGRDGEGSLNLHASAVNGSIVINPGDLNIGTDLAGPGLQAQSVLIFGNGVITQNNDSTGAIVTPSLDAHAATSITLQNPNNAATTVGFTTPGAVSFFNSVDTTINRASADHDGNGNQLPAANIDIEVADPSGDTSPGIFDNGNSATDNIDSSGLVILHAAGAITSVGNPIIANAVSLTSDTAGIGTASKPMQITASVLTAASGNNQDIVIQASSPNNVLTIGDGNNGINAGSGNVVLLADSAQVVSTANSNGVIRANNLRVSSASTSLYDVEVSTLSASANNGGIYISTTTGFQLANITGLAGDPAIYDPNGSVVLDPSAGNNSITQAAGASGRIVAGNFEADATASGAQITLTNPANMVTGTLVLNAAASAVFVNNTNTFLGSSSAGTLQVLSAGNLTINSGAVVTASSGGDAVVLVAANAFINNAGSNAVSLTGGGRFLIYSLVPFLDSFGNLNSNNTAVWGATFPATVSASGSRYLFFAQPILVVSANNIAKTYGTDVSGAIASDYTILNLQPGVAGAYLGDTAASVFSGTPTLSATGGTLAGDSVGRYSINVDISKMTIMDGYVLAFQNGVLTVNPATLTYNANTAGIVAGSAIPTLGGTVTGFVNGETQSSATTGTLAFNTNATASSPAGSYGITGSGLRAGNYVFVQAAGNSTAFTVTPAPQNTNTNTNTTPPPPVITPPPTTTITPPPSNPPAPAIQPLLSFTVTQQNNASLFLIAFGPAPPDLTTGAITPSSLVIVTGAPQPTTNPIQSMVASSDNGAAEPPTSSDTATDYVAQSLTGTVSVTPSPGANPIIIPGLLHAASGQAPGGGGGGVNGNDLSGWGNAALWQ